MTKLKLWIASHKWLSAVSALFLIILLLAVVILVLNKGTSKEIKKPPTDLPLSYPVSYSVSASEQEQFSGKLEAYGISTDISLNYPKDWQIDFSKDEDKLLGLSLKKDSYEYLISAVGESGECFFGPVPTKQDYATGHNDYFPGASVEINGVDIFHRSETTKLEGGRFYTLYLCRQVENQPGIYRNAYGKGLVSISYRVSKTLDSNLLHEMDEITKSVIIR